MPCLSHQEYKDIFQASHGAKLGFQSPFFLVGETQSPAGTRVRRGKGPPTRGSQQKMMFEMV